MSAPHAASAGLRACCAGTQLESLRATGLSCACAMLAPQSAARAAATTNALLVDARGAKAPRAGGRNVVRVEVRWAMVSSTVGGIEAPAGLPAGRWIDGSMDRWIDG